MKERTGCSARCGILVLCGLLLYPSLSYAQEEQTEPGHPIGKVSIKGDLIVMELDEGALGKAHLFDLVGRTLRFAPEGSRYRAENDALHWDSEFGPQLAGAEVTLHQFAFPFSGQNWNSFRVGRTGSISFGTPQTDGGPEPRDPSDGGVSIGRFDPLAEAASTLIDSCLLYTSRCV